MTTMIVDELARIPMSPFLTATLTRAADYATAQAHREVTLEHLLLALAEDPEATIVLKASHIDLDRLTAEVSDHLGRDEDRIDPSGGQHIAISADLRRILEAAAAAARQGRRREINGAIVLAAIVGDGKSPAAHMLRVQGLTFEEAIRALQHVTVAPPPPAASAPSPATTPAPLMEEPSRAAPPPHQPVQRPAPEAAHPHTAPTAQTPHRDEKPESPSALPIPEPTRPATTEEILAAARERLEMRSPAGSDRPPAPTSSAPAPAASTASISATPSAASPTPLPRANYPDRGGPPAHMPSATPPPPAPTAPAFDSNPANTAKPTPPPVDAHPYVEEGVSARSEMPGGAPNKDVVNEPRTDGHGPTTTSRSISPPPRRERRHPTASAGPFVGSWPLIEAGQLIENIPRRMRVGIPVMAEARIARADVKALAEGLAGGGGAFRHEVVVTKAMSVRLRSPGGGFTIENRSPETQWIETVMGLGSDDYASWRWTVTPVARGRRRLQLIVSARTIGADGVTAETALPDQIVEVRVGINYAHTAVRWAGWIGAALIGSLLAQFGGTAWIVLKIMFARYFGG